MQRDSKIDLAREDHLNDVNHLILSSFGCVVNEQNQLENLSRRLTDIFQIKTGNSFFTFSSKMLPDFFINQADHLTPTMAMPYLYHR